MCACACACMRVCVHVCACVCVYMRILYFCHVHTHNMTSLHAVFQRATTANNEIVVLKHHVYKCMCVA